MFYRVPVVYVLLSIVCLSVSNCNDGNLDTTKPKGTEGGECLEGRICNSGLICKLNICYKISADGSFEQPDMAVRDMSIVHDTAKKDSLKVDISITDTSLRDSAPQDFFLSDAMNKDTHNTDSAKNDVLKTDSTPVNWCASTNKSQIFSTYMTGCKGRVTFTERANLCAPNSHVCSATEWIAQWSSIVPTHNYWTDNALRYYGSSSGSCYASLTKGTSCPQNTPMRICAGAIDPLGNTCDMYECGYDSYNPKYYFGGCKSVDTTAGTLCCENY
jgi:hypothetical protein